MQERAVGKAVLVRVSVRTRLESRERALWVLWMVFLLGAAFYLWTAGTTYPLSFTDGGSDPYNQLANAFLHLHLSVARAPSGLMRLANPYDPGQNGAYQAAFHDFSLYHGKLFLTWGPAPVIVLLVPLHLLGLAPSSSLTASLFAIAGLGFALAALHVLLRQIGRVPLWMSLLAAGTLTLVSVVPFMLRRPEVYEEEIAAGYCFAMAAIWLVMSIVAEKRVSLRRAALASLCIGLAAGARAPLALLVVVLVPVYLSLRSALPRRRLLVALLVPVGLCVVLLLAYNQARFGDILQNGTKYQLAGVDQMNLRFGDPAYIPPGLWLYGLAPPRVGVLFPFLVLGLGAHSYPASLPSSYYILEPVGGLLPVAPVVVFLLALPWIWRRRAKVLGGLAAPLLAMAVAGLAYLLFLCYEFPGETERYEVDFVTLLLFGALATWLVLSQELHGLARWLVRVGGGLLTAWSCLTGLAISFTGEYGLLESTHPGIWETLENLGSPLSTAIALVEGHPMLFDVSGVRFVGMRAHHRVVVVSPDSQNALLRMQLFPARQAVGGPVEIEVGDRARATVEIDGPGASSRTYRFLLEGGTTRVPVHLVTGVNHLTIVPLSIESVKRSSEAAKTQVFLYTDVQEIEYE